MVRWKMFVLKRLHKQRPQSQKTVVGSCPSKGSSCSSETKHYRRTARRQKCLFWRGDYSLSLLEFITPVSFRFSGREQWGNIILKWWCEWKDDILHRNRSEISNIHLWKSKVLFLWNITVERPIQTSFYLFSSIKRQWQSSKAWLYDVHKNLQRQELKTWVDYWKKLIY
jgi:hypothetical protein